MITLKYITDITTERQIVVKDYSFKWIDEHWEDGISITGKKRNVLRGYRPVLELNFEHDWQLNEVAEEIFTVLQTGIVQYSTTEGEIPVVPTSFESRGDYLRQVRRKPSTLVLEGNIQGESEFIVTGVLCGATDIFCGQTDILCGA